MPVELVRIIDQLLCGSPPGRGAPDVHIRDLDALLSSRSFTVAPPGEGSPVHREMGTDLPVPQSGNGSLRSTGRIVPVVVLAVAAALGAGLWLVPETSPGGGPNSLGGQVIVADPNATGKERTPVVGATVTLPDVVLSDGTTPTAVTDSAGGYRFDNLPAGGPNRTRLRVVKAGYRTSDDTRQSTGEYKHAIELAPDP